MKMIMYGYAEIKIRRIRLHHYTTGKEVWVNVDHIQAHEENGIYMSGKRFKVKESLEDLDRLIWDRKMEKK